MKDRISKILREERMTASKFAEEIGVQASSISHIISGRNNPSIDFITKLLERFRGINAEWLLIGKGEMYKSSNKSNDTIQKPLELPIMEHNKELIDENTIENSFETNSNNKEDFTNLSTTETVTKPIKQDKEVEKIVIFFSDKTFKSYNPEEL